MGYRSPPLGKPLLRPGRGTAPEIRGLREGIQEARGLSAILLDPREAVVE